MNEPAKSYISLEHLYDYDLENTITHNNDCKHSLILKLVTNPKRTRHKNKKYDAKTFWFEI